MPPTRRSTNAVAGKSAKSAKAAQQHDQQQLPAEDQPLYDMAIVPEEGAAERALASAEAAMSVRRGEDDEEEATLEKSSHAEGDTAPILLAQASSTSKAADAHDSPASVGEELLRQAAPLPSTPPKAGPDGSESWLGKDWKLPVAIGGGALALLGLAAGGGGSANGSGISATPSATPPSSGNDGAPPPPSNTWNLTVTPAAGPFLAGASVRASAQKWVGGAWQEIASTTTVDRNGRMSFKIDKSMVTAQDILRVVVSDTGDSADHRDEIIGKQTLGATPLIAVIGGMDADQQVTANPLTTLAAMQIGQNLSPDNMNAIHAAVAKAFGISVSDLVHVLPVFLGGGGNPVETADGKNYGLALGVVAGMTQAQRAAGVPSNDALDKALKVLAGAFVTGADGKLVLDLQKVRSVEVDKGDGTKAQVGLDEGAARLYQATGDAEAGANGSQVPYISIDTKKEVPVAGQTLAKGVDANVSYSSFTDGLTLKINTAASAKVGDNLHIEFVRLDADGKPIADAKPFTYDYVLTKKDVDAAEAAVNDPQNKGGGFFTLTIPTHLDDPAKYNLENAARPAVGSSTDSSNFLLPAEKGANSESSFYKPNSGSAQFQLRATGSALGFASAGARIALFSDQIAIEAAPATSDRITFNGAGTGQTTSNTIKVVMTLPYKISWSPGNEPTLLMKVDGRDLMATYVPNGSTGDVLHFSLQLSSSDAATRGLDGAISIPDNALRFTKSDAFIYADLGNVLFRSDAQGKWFKRDGAAVPGDDLAKALGVKTQLNTPYKADTTPPADPNLEILDPPVFDSSGLRADATVPVSGKLNAISSANPEDAFSVVTNQIKGLKISVASGAFKASDNGTKVKLLVTADGFAELRLAEATVNDRGEAQFTDASYIQASVDSLTRFVKGKSAVDGVPLKLFAQLVDAAGNESGKVALKLPTGAGSKASLTLDLSTPDAPSEVKLDASSDTGRDGVAGTKFDNITSQSTPTLLVKGGSPGSVIQIWSDAAHTSPLGQGVVRVLPGAVSSNGATVTLSSMLKPGDNTVYVTITDQAGNTSADTSFKLNYLKPFDASSKLDLDITSITPAGNNGFYRKDDVIEVTVRFDRPVFLKTGKNTSKVYVILQSDTEDGSQPQDTQTGMAVLVGGLDTDTLKFQYKVGQNVEFGTKRVFKAISLVNRDKVLEDVAGSTIETDQAKAVTGQRVMIDTIEPTKPQVSLPADIADGDTFSGAAALGKGINLNAESGSTVRLVFRKAGVDVWTKSVTATGPGQSVKLIAEDLEKIGQGVVEVRATATDPAGNRSAPSDTVQFKLDTIAPKATVASNPGGALVNKSVTFVINFDEALKSAPTKDYFDVANGTVNEVTPGDTATSWKIRVTPKAGVASGNIELRLKSGVASPLSDKAGNLVDTDKILATQAIDTMGPTASATADAGGPVMGGLVSFTVVLSEAIPPKLWGAVGTGNFIATNGTVDSVTPIDGSGGLRYKVMVRPKTSSGGSGPADTTISLSLLANPDSDGALIRDALGNQIDTGKSAGQPQILDLLVTQVVDVTPPTVAQLTLSAKATGSLPPKDGYYHVGDVVTVEVKFSEAMKIMGQPTVDIDLGGSAGIRRAVFNKLSDDKLSAFFDYVIVAGDNASTGIGLPANGIKLAGGGITDLAGNPAVLASQAKASDPAGVKIDTQAPFIAEAKIDSANVLASTGLYKAGAELKASVRWSEEISIDTAKGSPELTLNVGGKPRTATYTGLAADKKTLLFTYTVAADDNDAAGITIPAGAVKLQGAVITDVSGNAAVMDYSGSPANASFKVDTTAPGVASVVVNGRSDDVGTSSGIYRVGDKVIVTVSFNEDMRLNTDGGSPTLSLQVGAKSRVATYVANSANGKNLTFSYTLAGDDAALEGVAVLANVLALNGASLTDLAGNASQLTYTALPANAAVKVDNASPTLLSFSATADKKLLIDDVLQLRAKVSEPLRAGASLTVKLSNGGEVVLSADSSDPTQLVGSYKVLPGQNSSDLKVTSVSATTGKDLAGNDLSTVVPSNGSIAAPRPIEIDAARPPKPGVFQLDAASDAGISNADGITNVTLPSFYLDGLVIGAKVVVTATNPSGQMVKLLEFTATATSQTVAMSGTALTDGVYSKVMVQQQNPSSNFSEMTQLGNTKTLGQFEISTVVPSTPNSLVFDPIQDSLAENEYGNYLKEPDNAKTPGVKPDRNYGTTIREPRFYFLGGKDGEVAVLFRDMNKNNRFDEGDILLGRKTIGSDSLAPDYTLTINSPDTKKNGHYVDVEAENALANALYTDINLVLQSQSGTYGQASGFAYGNLKVFSSALPTTLSGARVTEATSETATRASTLSFSVDNGQEGARVSFSAELVGADGSRRTVDIGSGILSAAKTVLINTSALNGRYENFTAKQTYAGMTGTAIAVTKQAGGDLVMVWDHLAPTVQVAVKPGNGPTRPGDLVELVFTFSEEIKDFTVDDIVVNGGTLIDFAGSGLTRTAKFKPNDGNVLKGDVQVNGASYTDVVGNAGVASNKLDIVFNRPGAITLSGISGSAPQVGETLSAAVSDPDGNPAGTVSYTWTVGDTTVAGNNTATYKVKDADKGKKIKVTASYTDGANTPDTASSSETAQVTGPNNPPQVVFKVNGVVVDPDKNNVLRYGDTVTVEVNDKDGIATSPAAKYSWLDSHSFTQGQIADARNFVVTKDILAKDALIHFRAQYTDQAGNNELWTQEAQSFRVRPKQQPGTVSIKLIDNDGKEVVPSGDLKLGDELKAVVQDENDAGKIEYHWIVGGEDRGVGSGSHYQVGSGDYGKDIKVQAIYVDKDGGQESPTSTTSFTVGPKPGNKLPTGDVTISGDGMLGTVLTAQPDNIKDDDGLATNPAYTYKWYSVVNKVTGEKTEISAAHFQGNDSSKLVVTTDLLGKDIQVEAQFKDLADFDNKVTGSKTISPSLPGVFTVTAPLSFTGLMDQDTKAKLLKVAPNSNLYILDVDGNGTIDQNDARTYIGNLDANASIGVTTAGGQGRATLLGKDSTWWSRFDELDKDILGTATGAKGVIGSGDTADVPAKDFWTASAVNASGNSHFVWTKDGAPYAKANISYEGDPNRSHYYLFEVKVNAGGVLPG
ncbi:Ig-like domain-containing protein [Herbaspirillum rubrisubalbicans]|nr:Ig-like domain-containing protein [Herbaspirillum rubrisubalbicans]